MQKKSMMERAKEECQQVLDSDFYQLSFNQKVRVLESLVKEYEDLRKREIEAEMLKRQLKLKGLS